MTSTEPSISAVAAALLDRVPATTAVAVADPEDPGAPLAAGDLVLGVGIGPDAAAGLLASAAASGAAAVLLRRPAVPDEQAAVERRAAAERVRLEWLAAGHGWNELHRQLVRRLTPPAIRADDELAELAQTIATLTGGLVTIEDTSARVLAYSRSSDEVDELRRLSILGRSGPAQYLALLREWGVYDRLSSSEEVVEIAEHPESGVRRRLAVGVFAGERQLATIWLQQGSGDFEPHAEQALLGAARITAAQLVSRGRRPAGSGAELAALLGAAPAAAGTVPAQLGSGPGAAGTVPARLGRAAGQPCAVAVAELGPQPRDPATAAAQLDELAAILTVHAAAYRRSALVEQLDGRVYALLPALDSVTSATVMLRRAMAAARRHLDPAARAAIGPMVDSVPAAAGSRRDAELALGLAGSAAVVAFDAVRSRLLIAAVENCLAHQQHLLDPRIGELIETDPEGARTLLNYFEAGSDVGRVASQMHLHPTTVRYRLRRVSQATGIDHSGGPDRFAVHLQLRCGLRTQLSAG
ncbi:PucR family transcriptional regulator [Jatrophihabitans sp.]|uniref:PucR family transcriptional regulator n=1 Tax=Jatrophihabitans sp. TaxID=1932789 RepID=UPI002B67B81D|nr:helix-turn-helix domain-containing protein [Jatrophihabitans sp.]